VKPTLFRQAIPVRSPMGMRMGHLRTFFTRIAEWG
jgi:hypothetical protein